MLTGSCGAERSGEGSELRNLRLCEDTENTGHILGRGTNREGVVSKPLGIFPVQVKAVKRVNGALLMNLDHNAKKVAPQRGC